MNPSKAGRAAFTLVELLVVIAIIGVLVALLLPAVQSAREAARRTDCQSRVRQMAIGWLNHHDAFNHLPTGGWGWMWAGDPDRGFGDQQPGSWVFVMLPFIEQQPLFDLSADGQPDKVTSEQQLGARATMEATFDLIKCPSRGGPQRHRDGSFGTYRNSLRASSVARADYAANAGSYVVQQNAGPSNLASAANFLWKARLAPDQLDGVCFQRSEIGFRKIPDGSSKTLMLGEKAHVPAHYETGDFVGDNESWTTGYNNDTMRGMIGDPSVTSSFSKRRFLEPVTDASAQALYDRFNGDEDKALVAVRFGASHPGVFVVAMCDGSVRGIGYQADPITLKRLAARNDGEPIDDGSL